ncbi:MAG: non-homologous end-joining DNA ligase [Anaerolineales bacterium]
MPFLKDRPLTMERYPDGIAKDGFYQKEAPDYFPDWIRRVSIPVKSDQESQQQLICDDEASLVYLVDQGTLTFHPWLSRSDRLDYPDKLIFDLDPPSEDFEPVCFAARALHQILGEVELASSLMTTGSSGLHVIVPLDRQAEFEDVRSFAKDLSNLLAMREPEKLTTEMNKDKRGKRLFLDYLRNSYGQNSVAPYTLRPLPGAPVATPLRWDKLSDGDLDSQTYTISNIFRRLGQIDDPWKNTIYKKQSLTKARSILDRIRKDQTG